MSWFSSNGKRNLLGLIFVVCFTVPASAEMVCSFTGNLNLSGQKLDLKLDFPGGGMVTARAVYLPGEQLDIDVSIDHLASPFFEISTDLELLLEHTVEESSKPYIAGRMNSRYPIINGRPAEDIQGVFKIRDHKLLLENFLFGDISGKGVINLQPPFLAEIMFHFSEMPMSDFLAFWARDEIDLEAAGNVSGQIQAAGPLPGPWVLKGSLAAFNGKVDQMAYESIILNAEGVYPVIHFAQSVVTPSKGLSFSIDGSIDLSKQDTLHHQIEALTKSPLIRENEASLEWTIKRKNEGTAGKTELKYLRRKNIKGGSVKEGSDMLGIERSIKF